MRIGVALQDVGLDGLMTAREMLVLQARFFGERLAGARRRADELLELVGLADVPLAKTVGKYSGGMKRRLDLALALVHDPKVLFLDEPTTGLDPASRAAIWAEVRRLNEQRGMTVFLTTQYLEEADRVAHQVAIIDRGRIVARGSPDELKRQMGLEVVSFTFADEEGARRASGVLGPLGARIERRSREVTCYVPAAAPALAPMLRALEQGHAAPEGIDLRRPTLDDVFLKATMGGDGAAGEPMEVAR
jgi:ABC-2 type transport system ATP-binding protein